MDFSDEDDLSACTPTGLTRAAGGVVMAAGLFTALQSVQLWGFVLLGFVKLVPFFMLVVGIGLIAVGFFVMKARGWAAVAATVSAGVFVVIQAVWVVYGLAHGFVSLLGFGVPPLALAAAVLAGIAIPGSLRADEARRRLAAQGLHMGV